MRREWIAVMMAGAMLSAGCVTNSQYQEALTEADTAREELEKVRQQKTSMEQQIRTLKELNVKFSNEALAARDELQRIEHGRDKERGSVDGRTKDLEEQLKALSAQNRNVRQEYQDVKRHNDTLKSLVARYQKELKDRSHSASAVGTPPAADVKAPAPAPSVAAPPAGPSAAMNINRVSASDLVLFLGLKQEEADRIVSNRPYRVKGELVAKNVVPKETFDLIKDRISVSQ
jgi:DNA uptake protein ComE-like DNA-binding protein